MNASVCSAQLQQLESRLRYSKTDKDTAEKKQRILMEKDLVDLQEKVHRFDVGSQTRSLESCSHHRCFVLAEDRCIASGDRRTREADR